MDPEAATEELAEKEVAKAFPGNSPKWPLVSWEGRNAKENGIYYTGLYGGFPKIRGTFLGSPYNKDYTVFGSILGPRYLGKLPYRLGQSPP